MVYENSYAKVSPYQVMYLLKSSTKALRQNFTYPIDKVFRESLLRTLNEWAESSIDFSQTKTQILHAIEKRPRWLGILIPSDCFTQILGTFGFFSFMDPTLSPSLGRRRFPIQGKVARLSRTLSSSMPSRLKIWQDFTSTFNYSETPFDSTTIQLFCDLKNTKNNYSELLPAGKSLIVGPSEIKESLSPHNYDLCLILVTPSSNVNTILQQTKILKAGWVINSALASLLCEPETNSKLVEAAQKAKMIYCNHNWTNRVQSVVKIPVISYTSNFMDLWMTGAPNLLHRALGVSFTKGFSATVLGANMYIAENIYHQIVSYQGYDEVQPQRTLHEFFTCCSYANHNPALNFITAKRMQLSGWVTGGEKIKTVLSWSLSEYLLALEKSIGERRL
jgi:hypothetical protein